MNFNKLYKKLAKDYEKSWKESLEEAKNNKNLEAIPMDKKTEERWKSNNPYQKKYLGKQYGSPWSGSASYGDDMGGYRDNAYKEWEDNGFKIVGL